jgi:hypothetical protein
VAWTRSPAIAVLGTLVACKADQPALTDASAALDAKCVGPNADKVLDTFPTTLAMPNAVLGAPDGMVATLIVDNVISIGFIGLGGITDGSGVDLRITTPPIDAGASALVRVAQADQVFRYAGTLDAGHNTFDLGVAMLTSAIYVRVTTTMGTIRIDAFEAVHDVCR